MMTAGCVGCTFRSCRSFLKRPVDRAFTSAIAIPAANFPSIRANAAAGVRAIGANVARFSKAKIVIQFLAKLPNLDMF